MSTVTMEVRIGERAYAATFGAKAEKLAGTCEGCAFQGTGTGLCPTTFGAATLYCLTYEKIWKLKRLRAVASGGAA